VRKYSAICFDRALTSRWIIMSKSSLGHTCSANWMYKTMSETLITVA